MRTITKKIEKDTRQKELIHKLLCSTDSHPDAYWLYNKARKIIPNISLGTVYRNLNLLVKQKKSLKLKAGAISRYDGNTTAHHHFQCKICNKIYDFDCKVNIKRIKGRNKGFLVEGYTVNFYGNCSNCSSKKAKDKHLKGGVQWLQLIT